ncbi:MAG TPA: hypothetical protein VLK25_07895 [Allosphingosinicella sp.]|nr:hypothetical protein [Allosphingosinicella sp.]
MLVDDERFERLARESERTGAPVGELVRRAIDREFPDKGRNAERERAGRELLEMPPPPGDGPEPDWQDQKKELRDARSDRWPGA